MAINSLISFLVVVLYIPLTLGINNSIANRKFKRSNPLNIYYKRAFQVKLIGVLGVVLIYGFYYGGGDTLNFWYGSYYWVKYLFTDPIDAFRILFKSSQEFAVTIGQGNLNPYWAKYWGNSATATTVKIYSILSFLGLNTYVGTAILSAFFVFRLSWPLFEFLYHKIESKHSLFFYAYFLLPSAVFWCSSVFKDTVCLGLILFSSHLFIQLFIERKIKIATLLYLGLCIFLLKEIRAYNVYLLIPSLILLFTWYKSANQKSPFLKLFVFIVLGVSGSLGAYYFINTIGSTDNSMYSLNRIEKTLEGFHSWHAVAGGESASHYDLNVTDYSPLGILKKAPISIITSLYRPFIWEVKSPIAFLTCIEGMLILGFTMFTFYKVGLRRFFKIMSGNYIAIFLACFSFPYMFIAGFTSYNFGALARYKVPGFMLFVVMLVFILDVASSKKAANNAASKQQKDNAMLNNLKAALNTNEHLSEEKE